MLKEAFLKRMKDILNDEYEAFLKSYDDPSMRAIRINKEKISVSDFLKINPFKVEKINLRDDCFYLKTDEKIVEINKEIALRQSMSSLAIKNDYFNYLFKGLEKYTIVEEEIESGEINESSNS